MQAFQFFYTPAQLNMTLVVAGAESLVLRDNETGALETWVPFAEGLVLYEGQRYGYKGDRTIQGSN